MPDITHSEMTEKQSALLNKLTKWLHEAETSVSYSDWLNTAKEDYKFYAGDQDTEAVKSKLAASNRPCLVFNQIKPKVDVIVGIGSDLRLGTTIKAAENTDKELAEVMGIVHRAKQRDIGTKDIEEDCFEHTVKSGRSLQSWFINSENPFLPRISSGRVEGYDFLLDPDGRDYLLTDHRFLFVSKWMDREVIDAHFPKFNAERVLAAASSQGPVSDSRVVDSLTKSSESISDFPEFFNEAKDKFRIIECWYRTFVKVVWFVNPLTNKPENLSPKDFKVFNDRMLELGKISKPLDGIEKPMKKVRFAIFTAGLLLEEGDNPYTGYNANHFPYTFYGANRDDDTNAWFGPTKTMKDPQRGFNTTLRQLLHLLQTLPKGIPMFEEGAVLNEEEYKEKSSDPTFILKVAKGALSRNAVQFQQQPSISPVYNQLIDLFNQLMKDLSSVQDPLLAIQTTGREPGITAQMRQQSNIVALFNLFNNFRRSRIHAARQLLAFQQQFINIDEFKRIVGPEFEELADAAETIISDIDTAQFDLIVDEGMEGKSMRLAIAKVLTEFNQSSPGSIPPDIIMEYSDVPASVQERVSSNNERNLELQSQEADRKHMIELLKIESKNQQNADKISATVFTELEKIAGSIEVAKINSQSKESNNAVRK